MEKSKKEEKARPTGKKPYTAPAFQHESVFEVSALACGKLQGTGGGCLHSRKAS
jgi:hypothetical protein